MKSSLLVSLLLASSILMVGFTHPTAKETAARPEVVGAFPAPPTGAGPGLLAAFYVNQNEPHVTRFAPSSSPAGNSFYVAYDAAQQAIYIPTAAGVTDIMGASSNKLTAHFPTIPGGRVAEVVPQYKLVLVLSGKELAAYSTTGAHKMLFHASVGGNALVVSPGGKSVYVGGNMDSSLAEVQLPTGTVIHRYPIQQSGDLIWARDQIFSADIKTGVMSILEVKTGRVVNIATPEVDPAFNYANIPAATAGFMQLAVSPNQAVVYAAGFSGHILKFSAIHDTYLGEIAVKSSASQPSKLSGIAVLPGGKQAFVTVENQKESVIVNLMNGTISKTFSQLMSNRWTVLPS